MALHRLSTPYGPAAFRALREAVDRVQADDPLAAVTVVVHSNAVGVAARRWLAANGGIAAAQFVTAFRFAELLGGFGIDDESVGGVELGAERLVPGEGALFIG